MRRKLRAKAWRPERLLPTPRDRDREGVCPKRPRFLAVTSLFAALTANAVALRHRAPPSSALAPTLRLTEQAGDGGRRRGRKPTDQVSEASEPDASRQQAPREVSAGRRYRAA